MPDLAAEAAKKISVKDDKFADEDEEAGSSPQFQSFLNSIRPPQLSSLRS